MMDAFAYYASLCVTGFYYIFAGLPGAARETILEHIRNDLVKLRNWFSYQTQLPFHGSSVLIVFETDKRLLTCCIDDCALCNKVVQVKLIDFTFIRENNAIDRNVLDVIEKLLEHFTSVSALFTAT